MKTNGEYGLEDLCVSLDGIEAQLKRLVELEKHRQKRNENLPSQIVEIDEI